MKTKVKSHLRKTKKGKRRVRQHYRKIKGGLIPKDKRKIFEFFAKQDIEYGGDMDFGEKKNKRFNKLQRFNTHIGSPGFVDLPDDYEVAWHVHPCYGYKTPSQEDMADFIHDLGNQAHIIFSGNTAISVVKTKKSNQLKKLSKKNLEKRYDSLYNNLENKKFNTKTIENIFINQLKKDGFKVLIHKKDAPIRLPIKVVE